MELLMNHTCYFGIGGKCFHCFKKRADHDALLRQVRARFIELILEEACLCQSPSLLEKAIEIEVGTRVRMSFAGIGRFFETAFGEVVKDYLRLQEFEVEIFRIFTGTDRNDNALFEYVRDIVAYSLETSPFASDRECGARLRQGQKIERTIIAVDSMAAAMQDVVRRPVEEYYALKERWDKLLFVCN
jgi:hypothetical protein